MNPLITKILYIYGIDYCKGLNIVSTVRYIYVLSNHGIDAAFDCDGYTIRN